MPRLLDSPTSVNLPLVPPDAITLALQIDRIVASGTTEPFFTPFDETGNPN